MNYFISHATTNTFVKAVGAPDAHTAVVIGAPNVSALISAAFHCWLASRETGTNRSRYSRGTVKTLLFLSAFVGVLGNGIHALAIDRSSVPLALLGRLLIGFSSCEILHREVVTSCVSSHVVLESARLALFRVCGSAVGLLLGSAYLAIPIAVQRFGHARQLQGPSWIMMLAWFSQLVRVFLLLLPIGQSADRDHMSLVEAEHIDNEVVNLRAIDDDSTDSDMAPLPTPSSVLYPSSSDVTPVDAMANAYGSGDKLLDDETGPDKTIQGTERPPLRQRWRLVGRIRRLLSFHIAIPISLTLYFYATYSLEVLYTGTTINTRRYFQWSGARAGTFLGCLALFILPIHFVCEIVARRYEERTILKVRNLLKH
jgi:hypothetical protein